MAHINQIENIYHSVNYTRRLQVEIEVLRFQIRQLESELESVTHLKATGSEEFYQGRYYKLKGDYDFRLKELAWYHIEYPNSSPPPRVL